MMTSDMELKRKRIETVVKLVGAGVVSFFAAPFVFFAIKGMIGLAIAATLGVTLVNLAPIASMKFANWRLKAIKSEASKNPIETLQNNYQERQRALGQFRENIVEFKTKVLGFADQLEGFKVTYPKDADKFDAQLTQMKAILQLRTQKWREAKANLVQFDLEIKKAQAIWQIGQAAAALNKAAGQDTDGFMAKLQVETALDSVQTSMNSAFSELEMSLSDESGGKPVVAIATPVDPARITSGSAEILDLTLDDTPAEKPEPVQVPLSRNSRRA